MSAPPPPQQQQQPPQGIPQNLTPQQLAQLQQIQMQQRQQQMGMGPKPDERIQAQIDASYIPVDIKVGENASARCEKHGLEKCEDCGIDFEALNRLSMLFAKNPHINCPPPPQVINKVLSQKANQVKEEGNTMFRTKQTEKAIIMYTQAANIAMSRAPWEPAQIAREEVATIMSNRSAAYLDSGDYIAALMDAEIVINLKKGWSKGFFRKARALVGLNQLGEARQAILDGLTYEPDNKDLIGTLGDIERAQRREEDEKQALAAAPQSTPEVAVAS